MRQGAHTRAHTELLPGRHEREGRKKGAFASTTKLGYVCVYLNPTQPNPNPNPLNPGRRSAWRWSTWASPTTRRATPNSRPWSSGMYGVMLFSLLAHSIHPFTDRSYPSHLPTQLWPPVAAAAPRLPRPALHDAPERRGPTIELDDDDDEE